MDNIIYQLVFQDHIEEFTLQQLEIRYTITGQNSNPSQRQELQGKPKIQGFTGPMYNGIKNGSPVIRYETNKEYASFS